MVAWTSRDTIVVAVLCGAQVLDGIVVTVVRMMVTAIVALAMFGDEGRGQSVDVIALQKATLDG